MGGFFNKKSTTNTTAFNAVNNQGVSEVDGDVLLLNGSGNTVTDGGAIRGAMELSENLAGGAFKLADNLAGDAFRQADKTFDFMGDVDAANTSRLRMMLDQNENLIDKSFANAQGAVTAVSDAFKQDASPNRDFMMLGVVVAGAVVAAAIFKG